MTESEKLHHAKWLYVNRDEAVAEIYDNGAVRMRWKQPPWMLDETRPPQDERGCIKDQSRKSRHRCAFAFRSAPCRWGFMSLLTWGPGANLSRDAILRCFDRLRREWKERWGEPVDAWVMEMHSSGIPHVHLFHAKESEFGAACMSSERHQLTRRGELTYIVRGAPDRWLVGTWLKITGQLDCPSAMAFNKGGIIEWMRSDDAAARYVEKEASKGEQKVLPERYAEGLGRWWWIAPRWEGRQVGEVTVELGEWPMAAPCKHVWQPHTLDGLATRGEPLTGEELRWNLHARNAQAKLKTDAAKARRAARGDLKKRIPEPSAEPLIIEKELVQAEFSAKSAATWTPEKPKNHARPT